MHENTQAKSLNVCQISGIGEEEGRYGVGREGNRWRESGPISIMLFIAPVNSRVSRWNFHLELSYYPSRSVGERLQEELS